MKKRKQKFKTLLLAWRKNGSGATYIIAPIEVTGEGYYCSYGVVLYSKGEYGTADPLHWHGGFIPFASYSFTTIQSVDLNEKP